MSIRYHDSLVAGVDCASKFITSQEYAQLSAAEKNADIVYYITDDYYNPSTYPIDSVPMENSTNAVSSGGVKSALTQVETDLAGIHATGSTNATGSTITSGTFFYLNNALVVAKTDIANGATFTSGTNYEVPTAGGLNALKSAIDEHKYYIVSGYGSGTTTEINYPTGLNYNNCCVVSAAWNTNDSWYNMADINEAIVRLGSSKIILEVNNQYFRTVAYRIVLMAIQF